MIDCLWPNTKKARDMRALNIWSDLFVVTGADLRLCLPLVNQFFRSSPERHGKLLTLNQRISLRIHHNGKGT